MTKDLRERVCRAMAICPTCKRPSEGGSVVPRRSQEAKAMKVKKRKKPIRLSPGKWHRCYLSHPHEGSCICVCGKRWGRW